MGKGLVLLIFILSIISCTRSSVNESVENQIQGVQKKIDQARYDEALTNVRGLIRKYPQNSQLKVIEASVYVHRAGLRLKDYFELAALFSEDTSDVPDLVDLKSIEQKLSDLKIVSSEDQQKALELVEKVNEFWSMLHRMEQKIESIPLIEDQAEADLQTAIHLLDQIQTDENMAGIQFYRGIINLIYFKYLLHHDRVLPTSSTQLCQLKVSTLHTNLQNWLLRIQNIILDLAAGFPKSKDSFLKNSSRLKEISDQAQLQYRQIPRESSQGSVGDLLNSNLQNNQMKELVCAP